MKAYRIGSGITPPVLNLGISWRIVINFIPRRLFPSEKTPVHIK